MLGQQSRLWFPLLWNHGSELLDSQLQVTRTPYFFFLGLCCDLSNSLLLKVCAFSRLPSCCRRAWSNPALLREMGMVRDFLSAAAHPAPSWLLLEGRESSSGWRGSPGCAAQTSLSVRERWLLWLRKGNDRWLNERWIWWAAASRGSIMQCFRQRVSYPSCRRGPGQPHYPQYNFAAVLQVRRQSKDRKGLEGCRS